MAERKVNCIPATVNIKAGTAGLKPGLRKVAGYARVSTDSDEQFTSYEAQIDYYTKKIKANPGWEFVKVYSDEGISGTSTKYREGFNAMIRDAMDGKIDLIVTKSVSRFARNTVDSLTTIRTLKEKNVECYFEKENIHTFDGKGELLLTIMASLAQEESRSISENVTWGKRKEFSDGRVSMSYSSFLGYRRGKDGLPEIDEGQAEIVRKIYRLYLEGNSLDQIKRILEKEEVPSPKGGKHWYTRTLSNILSNERYKGTALLQKTFTVDYLTKTTKKNNGEVQQYYVENSHPAIIDENEWELVQIERARRSRLGSEFKAASNVFSSRLVCGDCGGVYARRENHPTANDKKFIWRCHRKYRRDCKGGKEQNCGTPNLKEEDIISRFLDALGEIMDCREEIIEHCREMYLSYTDNSKLDGQIKDSMRRCEEISENARKWIEQNSKTIVDQQVFKEKYDFYVAEFDKEDARLNTLKEKKRERESKAEAISGFMFELRERDKVVDEFSADLWNASIEIATVQCDGSIVFKFKDGREVTR